MMHGQKTIKLSNRQFGSAISAETHKQREALIFKMHISETRCHHSHSVILKVYSPVECCVVTASVSPLITHTIRRQLCFTPFDLTMLSQVGLPRYLWDMKCSSGDYETQCLRSIPDYTASYITMSLEYVFNFLLIVGLSC
jgi:hypothetical protein